MAGQGCEADPRGQRHAGLSGQASDFIADQKRNPEVGSEDDIGLNMNGSGACFWFRLAQFLCRQELRPRKYNVAPRDLMPETKMKIRRSLAVRIKTELRFPNHRE